MLVKIVGIRRNFSFLTKDGKEISGSNIYITRDQEGVEGLMCEKYFLNSKFDTTPLKPGVDIELFFNRYGKVDSYHVHR